MTPDYASEPAGAGPEDAEHCLHEVWAELTARGLIIEEPEPGVCCQCSYTNLPGDPCCEMDLMSSGALVWIYVPQREAFTAIQAARTVLALLTGTRRPAPDMPPAPDPALALKDAAARMLADCGMTARSFDIHYSPGEIPEEVVATNPAWQDRGYVRISDEGTIRWECRFTSPGSSTAAGLSSRDVAAAIDAALAMAEGQTR